MAKNKSTETDNPSTSTIDNPPIPEMEAPEGYSRVTAAEGDWIWWHPGDNENLEGILLGRFLRKGKQTGTGSPYYYQVKLKNTVTGVVKVEDGEVQVIAGRTINVGEAEGLKCLKKFAEDCDSKYSVFINSGVKVKLANGNSMRKYSVFAKRVEQLAEEIPF